MKKQNTKARMITGEIGKDNMIRKEVWLSPSAIKQLQAIADRNRRPLKVQMEFILQEAALKQAGL